jgi:two-component system, NarL family, sensor histidine kinase BarA
VSYRTFRQHLLGKTNLEQKCRFLFGVTILVLVTFSFCWFARNTESLVIGQNTQSARMLVKQIITDLHINSSLGKEAAPFVDEMWGNKTDPEELSGFQSRVLNSFDQKHEEKQARTPFEREALARFQRAALSEPALRQQGKPHKPYTFSDGTPMESIEPGKNEYRYIKAVVFTKNCLGTCHEGPSDHQMRAGADGKYRRTQPGDLAGAVVVQLSMNQTNRAIERNRAVLITTALATALVAMFSSWAIVGYVIAKPIR